MPKFDHVTRRNALIPAPARATSPTWNRSWSGALHGVFRVGGGVELRAQHGADGVRRVPGGGL